MVVVVEVEVVEVVMVEVEVHLVEGGEAPGGGPPGHQGGERPGFSLINPWKPDTSQTWW